METLDPLEEADDPSAIRTQALWGFTLAAIGSNRWVYSEGAREDALHDLNTIQMQPLNDSWVANRENWYNVASMLIIQNLVTHMMSAQIPVIWREIDGIDELYDHTESSLRAVGFNRAIRPSDRISQTVARCCLKNTIATSPIETSAQTVWQDRGSIVQEMVKFTDIVEAEKKQTDKDIIDIQVSEAGLLFEIFDGLDVPSTAQEIPFYEQYVDREKGAHNFLLAYLEDLQALNNKLMVAM